LEQGVVEQQLLQVQLLRLVVVLVAIMERLERHKVGRTIKVLAGQAILALVLVVLVG
jgi:hypothetical protein